MLYATGAYTLHCQEYHYQDITQTVCTAIYDINESSEVGPSQYAYTSNDQFEDWAESFMGSVYPSISGVIVRPIRKQFVLDAVSHVPDAAFWR